MSSPTHIWVDSDLTMQILKYSSVFLWSGIKFLFALIQAAAFNLGYWQSILLTVAGGMMGVVVFAYLDKPIVRGWRKIFPAKISTKTKINKKSRMLVRIKKRYGLAGIALLTPIILQVPIGTMLAMRMIGNIRKVLIAMFISFSIYSCIAMTIFYFILSDEQRLNLLSKIGG
ncbi:MAG: hypothetical protein SGJ04_00500 [Bacteroidota bacterium]|nr:hypothetical protein [Bacteroidota bacterium]